MSIARQDWDEACEARLNEQINMEIAASHTYQAMWTYFARDDVGLENIGDFFKQAGYLATCCAVLCCAVLCGAVRCGAVQRATCCAVLCLENIGDFFKQESADERQHSQTLINYQLLRGGRVNLTAIAPPKHEYAATEGKNDALVAFEAALGLEKKVNTSLKVLHKLSEDKGDVQFCGFLEGNFLAHQLESQRELALVISKLKRIGTDASGLLTFNNELLKATH